ncbi:matrix metalloproteinase-9-like [Pogona vitticeps]
MNSKTALLIIPSASQEGLGQEVGLRQPTALLSWAVAEQLHLVCATSSEWPTTPFLLTSCVSFPAPRPCVFPFIYKQKSYSSCTKDGAIDLKLWCATTANFDRDRQWKHCAPYEYGGNSGGQNCTFPFAYKKRTFYTCTSEDALYGRFWCATTGSYDKDRRWSYCADTRLAANSQGPCVFPFIYNFKSYSTCTTDGEPSGRLWCSLSSNYDIDSKRAYCDLSGKG